MSERLSVVADLQQDDGEIGENVGVVGRLPQDSRQHAIASDKPLSSRRIISTLKRISGSSGLSAKARAKAASASANRPSLLDTGRGNAFRAGVVNFHWAIGKRLRLCDRPAD
jgi:hypothetical protein